MKIPETVIVASSVEAPRPDAKSVYSSEFSYALQENKVATTFIAMYRCNLSS